MKHYVVTGDELDRLEDILKEHEIESERYESFDVLTFRTQMPYEQLQDICKDYEIQEQTTKRIDYDTKNE